MSDSQGGGPKGTRRWVLIADRVADRVITIGGILVIAAVMGMMVFLVAQVTPLFKGGTVEGHVEYTVQGVAAQPLGISTDDYKTVAVSVAKNGTAEAWHARTGLKLHVNQLDFGDKRITAFARNIDNTNIVFGFSDGSARLGKIEFKTEVLPSDQLPAGLKKLDGGGSSDGISIYTDIPNNQVRKTSVELILEDEIKVSQTGDPIVLLDTRFADFGERPVRTLLAVDGQGSVTLLIAETKLNLFTRKTTTSVSTTILPPLPHGTRPEFALVNQTGDQAYLAERNGKIYRYNVADRDKPLLVETEELMPPGVQLTALGFLVGDKSMVVGGSDGSVNIYFLLDRKEAKSADGMTLVRAREFEALSGAITGLSADQRGKTFAVIDDTGEIRVLHGTSKKTLIRLPLIQGGAPPQTMTLTPRLDGLLATGSGHRVDLWDLSIQHPETSFGALFGKVWYEGYSEPSYTWQSTGATDAFESKLSLVPLIFGTLKATFYSLIFAIPIALLAAVYTSEFLSARLRGKVKPVMEVMASLPSVVLGFVAALVLAPVVETWISAVLLAFVALPVTLIACAFLWQLLPPTMALRLDGMPKFLIMCVAVGASLFLAYSSGPLMERLLFGGNFTAWLNADTGSAVPILFLLAAPVVTAVVSFTASQRWGHTFKVYLRGLNMPYAALVDLARWMIIAAVSLIASYPVAVFLNWAGFDPRSSFMGTYVQRNTLVVGFAMGFAVIPLIYTLAEDALNSVPEHLRSASLGCGATPWQTAIWIIVPTALSGVFSAIMIGMGRAVGETMILVMAAGNTPLLDMNIFNGLRALSANIAVELPEAPKDGSLYRVLFLTGLVLFGMTFIINTVAELVRIRFRKRAVQL
jgi:phosphate transport system permease protein